MTQLYHDGIQRALDGVAGMSRDRLLDHLGALYGVPADAHELTDEELRAEAVRQTRLDFRLPEAEPTFAWIDAMAAAGRRTP